MIVVCILQWVRGIRWVFSSSSLSCGEPVPSWRHFLEKRQPCGHHSRTLKSFILTSFFGDSSFCRLVPATWYQVITSAPFHPWLMREALPQQGLEVHSEEKSIQCKRSINTFMIYRFQVSHNWSVQPHCTDNLNTRLILLSRSKTLTGSLIQAATQDQK